VSSIRFHAVRAVATVGLLVLSAVSYASLVREDVRWTVYKHNPDWRSAASAVRTRHNPGERQILFGVIPLDDFAFYLRHAMESDRPEMRWYDDRGFDRLVSSGMATQIVIVRNGAWASGVDRAINRAREDRRLRLAWHDRFKLVDLYTFVPAETGPGAERLPAATP
jgi:hypothetical protein